MKNLNSKTAINLKPTDEKPVSLPKKFPKEYKTWCNIRWRCHCKTARDYHKYGRRGIKVSKRWRRSFKAFFSDVGSAPSRLHSLERMDNSRGYESGNVKWATIKEQNLNRRNTLFIRVQGEMRYFAEWCRENSLSYGDSRRKLAAGWSAEELIKGEKNVCKASS